MLVAKNRGYKRKYIYGGSGIFETIGDFLRRLLGSTVAKQAAKQVAKQAASVALDVGKTAAFTAGKKLADRVVNKLTKQPDDLGRKAGDVIDKYIPSGSGNAIAIQDLVRRMNGSILPIVSR